MMSVSTTPLWGATLKHPKPCPGKGWMRRLVTIWADLLKQWKPLNQFIKSESGNDIKVCIWRDPLSSLCTLQNTCA